MAVHDQSLGDKPLLPRILDRVLTSHSLPVTGVILLRCGRRAHGWVSNQLVTRVIVNTIGCSCPQRSYNYTLYGARFFCWRQYDTTSFYDIATRTIIMCTNKLALQHCCCRRFCSGEVTMRRRRNPPHWFSSQQLLTSAGASLPKVNL